MIFVSISHVYREANMVADWLAKAGQTMFHSKISWETSPPQELGDIMVADRIGRALVRRDV